MKYIKQHISIPQTGRCEGWCYVDSVIEVMWNYMEIMNNLLLLCE